MKAPSPLLGFNNNVRHKGRVFHIQTEDSGVRHPHIITHLFADGGRIVKTAKTSYAEYLDAKNMGELVKQMMQDQHKTMLMALKDGQFDHLVDELLSRGGAPAARPSSPTAAGPVPSSPTASNVPIVQLPAQPPAQSAPAPSTEQLGLAATVQVPSMPSASALVSVRTTPALGQPSPPPPSPPSPQARQASPLPIQPPPPSQIRPVPIAGPPPLPTVSRPTPPAAPPEPKLPPRQERVAAAAPPPTVVKIPPPPAASSMAESVPPASAPSTVQRFSTGGALPGVQVPSRPSVARPRLDIDPGAIHGAAAAPSPTGATISSIEGGPSIDMDTLERAAAAEPEAPFFPQIRDLPPPPAAVLGPRTSASSPGSYSSVSTPQPSQPSPTSTRGRYSASRPSSIFASVRPQEGASIFGEDLISEKSLDEVILSYLAEDLDGTNEKK